MTGSHRWLGGKICILKAIYLTGRISEYMDSPLPEPFTQSPNHALSVTSGLWEAAFRNHI